MSRFVLAILVASLATAKGVPPLVIVPGLGGSVLEAKLHNRPTFRDCQTESDWYTIWASVTQGIARYACFIQDIALTVSPAGSGSGMPVANFTGVEIRPRDFGGTGGIKYSNAGTHEPPIAYMLELVTKLEKVGYVSGISLRAATNDFRSAGVPEALEYQYQLLRNLVEDTYAINGNAKVHLLSHSLGGPYTNLFLVEYVSAPWKDKYIASHISLSNPVMGSVPAIEGILSGPMYDWVPQFLPKLIVPAIRSFPSIAWMFPRVYGGPGGNVWGGDDPVFVSTPTHNYSMSTLGDLARAVNATVIYDQWDRIREATKRAADDPDVPVLCVYANDTKTDLAISLPDDKFNSKGTRVASTWGDGTVNLASLQACNRWSNVTERPIKFGGSLAAHTEIVQNNEVIKIVIQWLTGA